MNESINGSGYNENYGLLGSNKATEDQVKLFPRECQPLVEDIQARILKETGKLVEVMVYGDGAFRILSERSGSLPIRSFPPLTPQDSRELPTSSSSSILQITILQIFRARSLRQRSRRLFRKRTKTSLDRWHPRERLPDD
jgi:hypothetical protein